jgi:spore maturation protein CgeB
MIWDINKKFLKKVFETKPDLIFIYRGTHILPNSLQTVKKKMQTLIFTYNNDDAFSSKWPKYVWRHFLKGLKYCDWIFAYRKKNIEDYKKLGFNNVSLLMPYYIKEFNYPIEKLPYTKYKSDVIFIGHYEDDGRDEYIKLLIEHNINCKLYGTYWERSRYYKLFKEKFGEIKPLYGKDYNIALNSAKIALAFLSKINNDTYTRRCFEIPATKTFMFCEYTKDVDELFKEGIEAEYFRNKEEFIKKIKFYLEHENLRERIAENGYKKVTGHEVTARAKEVISVFERLAKTKKFD